MITAFIVIGVVLAAVLGVATVRRVRPDRALPSGTRDVDLFTLELGDVVQHVDVDYIVEGKLVYQESSGFSWNEYMLSSGVGTPDRWLSVEEDDRVSIALVEKIETPRAIADGARPQELEHAGVTYRRVEHGNAKVTRRQGARAGTQQELRCEFWDYEAGEQVLSIEQWGDELEVCVGRTIPPSSLTCLPGSDRGTKQLTSG